MGRDMPYKRSFRVSDEQIVQAYSETLSAYKAAERLGINWKTVYDALARSGVAANGLRTYREKAKKFTPEQEKEILSLYESGVPTPELKRRYGGSASTYLEIVRRNGGKIRPWKGRPSVKLTDADEKDICDRYKAGMSSVALATITEHSQPTICMVLRRNGIELRRRRKNKVRHRWVHPQGYVYVRVEPDDPMVVMCMTKGVVAEHRLVMARKLGRPLLKTETVHHINGDRQDNRIENLQLRQGKHGKHVVMCCLDCGSRNVGPAPLCEET